MFMHRVLLLILVTTGCDPARVLTYDKILCATDAECDDGSPCTTEVCERLLGCVITPLTEGTVCRPGAGPCDYDDTCDADGTCVDNRFAPTGSPCGDATTSECDGADTCTRQGVCSANFMTLGTTCGDPTESACDRRDTCNGAGLCLENLDAFGTPCGSGLSTDCTAADTCDGQGACQANHATDGSACGETVECEVRDTCDGGGTCIDNGQAAPGAACGDATDDACTEPDTCDAAGVCQENHALATTACGDPTNNQCTDADTCDGAGACDGNHEVFGAACGSSASGECDNPDACDGLGTCQPRYSAIGSPCGNAAVSACDGADTCDGAGTCLDNAFPPGGPCGDTTDDQCTAPDTCSAGGTCLPNHITGPCGDSSESDCDHADTCDLGVCVPNHESNGASCDDCPAGAGSCADCSGGVCIDDTCGDNTIDSGEVCDGTDPGPCPGPCQQTGCTCYPINCLALLENGATTGVHSIDPDGPGTNDPFNAFCDMDLGTGGWTLLAWTGDSDGASVISDGVPYPGLDPCPALDCLRGSATTATTTTSLLAVSTSFAKAQDSTTLTGHGALADYSTVGVYTYGDLSSLAVTYGATTCDGTALATGTFTMAVGLTDWDNDVVFLAQALSADGNPDFTSDGADYTWSVGTITSACLPPNTDLRPSTWMGTVSTDQAGPDNATVGAHSVWVR